MRAIIAVTLFIILWSYLAARHWILKMQHKQQEKLAKDLRFLQIKMPRIESEHDKMADAIQSMKQNIEVMNQVYKNLWAIGWDSSWKATLLWQQYISCEILIEKEVILFYLWVPQDYVETFEKMISSFYSGAVIDTIPQPKLLDAGKFMATGHFVLAKDTALPIKTYEGYELDPMDSVLSSFARVDIDEKLILQVLISPLDESRQQIIKKKVDDFKSWKKSWLIANLLKGIPELLSWWGKKDESENHQSNKFTNQQISDLEQKYEDDLFMVTMRVGAISPIPTRPEKMIQDLARSMKQYTYTGLNGFTYSQDNNPSATMKDIIARNFVSAQWWWKALLWKVIPMILNLKEVASVYHFPHIRFNKNPRIRRQNFKIVPAPDSIPSQGLLLGYNIYGGVKKMIHMSEKDRFRHFYCIGQTGTGKSTTLLAMARQDMDQGKWFTLIDPHGDLSEQLLQYFPKERIDDLIYRDAGYMDLPFGFNFLNAKDEREMDLVTNDAVDMFIKLYGPEIFGPRIQDYFRNGVLTLMEQPDWGTLVEIMRLFTDAAYQKIKVSHIKNPVVRSWWEKTFNAMGDREKWEMIPYFQAKFGPLTTTPILRNIIGQTESSFEINQVMDSGKILLMNLSKGKMWDLNANMLGMMIVSQIRLAAFRRAEIPEEQRVPHYLYIDEFQNFVTPAIESILSEARKYRLSLNIAHQYIKQLEQWQGHGHTDLTWPIFGNVGNFMYMRVGNEDAETLWKSLEPYFSSTDLVNIDKFKWVLRLVVDSQPTKPFTLSVWNPFADPVRNSPEKVEIIKQISALKYWRKKELVDKEIFYRVGA
jgi:hypothetical protein